MIVSIGRKSPLFLTGQQFRRAMAVLAVAQLLTACNTPSPYQNVPSPSAARPTDKPPERTTAIQAGDVLEVFVVEDDSLNGRYDVGDGGNIIFPKIGKVPVAGKTSPEVEQTIKKLLEVNQLRTATVMVERPAQARTAGGIRGKTVFVSGSVTTPGRRTIPYVGELRPTLYQAIVDAGGFARFADQSHVLINRRGPDGRTNRVSVDAKKIRDGSAPDVPLEDGDMIYVPEKEFGW